MNQNQGQGAIALTRSLDNGAAEDRNFQATMQLDQYVKQQRYEQEQAQLQEQRYYDNINEQAKNLLGYDQEKIQQRARKIQSSIQEKMKFYGGDKRKFMANGGHQILSKFESNVVNSPEFNTFKENQKNLTRIMDAQMKGFGHLITPQDIDSVKRYQENKGGTITYAGQMSEVDMPDPNNYDLGRDIPMSDILTHKDNYVKILGNYKMQNPENDNPSPEELMAFGYSMGYGTKGSNRESLRFAQKLALTKAAQKPVKSPEVKADKRQVDVLTNMTKTLGMMPDGMRVQEFYDPETLEEVNFYRDRALGRNGNAKDNYIAQNVSKDPWNFKSRKSNLDEAAFFDIHSPGDGAIGSLFRAKERMFNDQFMIAGANRILEGFEHGIANAIFGQEVVNNKINLEPDESMFRMDGVQMSNSERLEPGKYEGDYEIVGLTTAGYTTDSKGQGQLLMTVHDDNGDIDKDATKNFRDGLTDQKVQPSIVMALKNKDGLLFYKKINIEQDNVRSVIMEKLGDSAILNDEIEAGQRNSETFAVAERAASQMEESYRGAMVTIDKQLEENPSFKQEAGPYSDPVNQSINRSELMKSAYVVMSGASDPSQYVKSMNFDNIIKAAGPEVETKFKTFGHSMGDEALIDYWLSAMNKNESEEVVQNNYNFAQQWKLALKEYSKINK